MTYFDEIKLKTVETEVDRDITIDWFQSVTDACWFARGLRSDWKRRLPHYVADYKDGQS